MSSEGTTNTLRSVRLCTPATEESTDAILPASLPQMTSQFRSSAYGDRQSRVKYQQSLPVLPRRHSGSSDYSNGSLPSTETSSTTALARRTPIWMTQHAQDDRSPSAAELQGLRETPDLISLDAVNEYRALRYQPSLPHLPPAPSPGTPASLARMAREMRLRAEARAAAEVEKRRKQMERIAVGKTAQMLAANRALGRDPDGEERPWVQEKNRKEQGWKGKVRGAWKKLTRRGDKKKDALEGLRTGDVLDFDAVLWEWERAREAVDDARKDRVDGGIGTWPR